MSYERPALTGMATLVMSKILNHVESGITAVYDRHSYDAEKHHLHEVLIPHSVNVATSIGRRS